MTGAKHNKGRTIRKVMGVGDWLARILGGGLLPVQEFFFDCSAVHEFFF